ncbi:MAG: LLM class flavin-dependent oxidoreductase [Beijerinckiaceae bacterium]|nr:LLM class flavin-dependent oxidoreductase [Beijerinckiaceae bacterium]
MRQMKLGLFLAPGGHHMAAWRHPEAYPDGVSVKSYVSFAQLAERGLFDMLFVADVFSLTPGGKRADSFRLEPLTLLSALAMTTEKIGLVATATTSFNEPYNVARKFASLDHISGGRAGWNIVTSSSPLEAYNFGYDAHFDHADRYRRADEFTQVVRGLWDCIDDDAVVIDKERGVFFEPDKVRRLNHEGEHYRVRGPLSLPRSPQGNPVLVQAGSSEDGKSLAAKYAEVIFTIQRDVAGAKEFYQDIKARAASFGRDPSHALIMPGVMPIIGRTRQEAQDKYELLQSLIHREAGLTTLGRRLGMDLSGIDIEGPLPPVDMGSLTESRAIGIVETSRRENMSVRETWEKLVVSKGHRQLIGTASDIADSFQEWFEQGGADGFNVMPAFMPGGLTDFVDLVVPELQRRGLFRKAYEGNMLRDHLGLPRPAPRIG